MDLCDYKLLYPLVKKLYTSFKIQDPLEKFTTNT
jgi:hypothetical protein